MSGLDRVGNRRGAGELQRTPMSPLCTCKMRLTSLRLLLIPLIGALATTVGSGAPPSAPAVPPAGGDFAQIARPVLQQFCVECHGPDKQKARLRYDQLAGYRIEDRNLWAKMHEQI